MGLLQVLRTGLTVAMLVIGGRGVQGQFNSPKDVDTWCGKAYMASNSSFDPGGRLEEPAMAKRPLLDLHIYPRHSLYLEDEKNGTFVVDAALSWTVGEPYCSTLGDGYIGGSPGAKFRFIIFRGDTGGTVIESVELPVNSTGNEIPFSLADFPASTEPYDVVVKTMSSHCGKTYESTARITRLPKRKDNGTVVRVDNLYSGLQILDGNDSQGSLKWKSIFPYSFYVDYGGYLAGSKENLTQFAQLGYNIIHPTPGGDNLPWDFNQFDTFLTQVEEMGMYLMYDMRWTFKNLSSVEEQVNRLKSRKGLLLWYTGDEPDGQGDPLDSTVKAYQKIRSVDPYHPVSLVLNCDNFHYGDYAAGADIIMADPYPVAVNMSFSVRFSTPCNSTYGDCGCDNCAGELTDVGTRMDRLRNYQSWLRAGPKSFWGVPQAFGGSEYWARTPTAAEEAVMVMLFVNHDAKGIVAWNFPTTPELTNATSSLAKVLSADSTSKYVLGAKTVKARAEGHSNLDVAAWQLDYTALISVVNTAMSPVEGEVKIKLGVKTKMSRVVWPIGAAYNWTDSGEYIVKNGMAGMEVNLFEVEVFE